jgi:hypothetical protein
MRRRRVWDSPVAARNSTTCGVDRTPSPSFSSTPASRRVISVPWRTGVPSASDAVSPHQIVGRVADGDPHPGQFLQIREPLAGGQQGLGGDTASVGACPPPVAFFEDADLGARLAAYSAVACPPGPADNDEIMGVLMRSIRLCSLGYCSYSVTFRGCQTERGKETG